MDKVEEIFDLIDKSLTNLEIDELKEKLRRRADKFFVRGKGRLLVAIDPCNMNDDPERSALIVGKSYSPSKTDKYGTFTIKSEIDPVHQFTKDTIR